MDCRTYNQNTISLENNDENTTLCDKFSNLKITSSEHILGKSSSHSINNQNKDHEQNCQIFDSSKRVIEHLDNLEIKQSKPQPNGNRSGNERYRFLENIKEKEEEYFKEEANILNSNKSLDSILIHEEFNKLEKIYIQNSLLHKTKHSAHEKCLVLGNDKIPLEGFNSIIKANCSQNVSSLNTQDTLSQEASKKTQLKIGSEDRNEFPASKSPKFRNFNDLEIINEAYYGEDPSQKVKKVISKNPNIRNEVNHDKFDFNNIKDLFNVVS